MTVRIILEKNQIKKLAFWGVITGFAWGAGVGIGGAIMLPWLLNQKELRVSRLVDEVTEAKARSEQLKTQSQQLAEDYLRLMEQCKPQMKRGRE